MHVQTKLDEKVKVKMCQSIVDEVLWMVRTPERPSTPAELGVNEEQEFLSQNPKVILQMKLILLSDRWSLLLFYVRG